jgi:hypothetical protein
MVLLTAALAATLTVGVAAAAAHGGPGGPGGHGPGLGGGSVSSLVTQAAKQLNVTRAKLVSAIQDSAATHISNAASDGDITSSQADDLKAEAQDNLNVAYALSETKTVASNLGITTTALNTGFRAARKTLATAQIDAALAAGRITADEATSLKSKLDSATLPGYKGGLGGPGFGGPHR